MVQTMGKIWEIQHPKRMMKLLMIKDILTVPDTPVAGSATCHITFRKPVVRLGSVSTTPILFSTKVYMPEISSSKPSGTDIET